MLQYTKIACGALFLVIGGLIALTGLAWWLTNFITVDLCLGIAFGFVSLGGLLLIVSGINNLRRPADAENWEDEYW